MSQSVETIASGEGHVLAVDWCQLSSRRILTVSAKLGKNSPSSGNIKIWDLANTVRTPSTITTDDLPGSARFMPYGAVLAAVNQDLVLFPRLDGTEPHESIGRHSAENEDMEGELAGRCNSFTQQQGMRVCVGLDMIWLDFMSLRPLSLEDGETTISKLCLIAERLSNSLLNHSVEAFRQIGVAGGKTLYLWSVFGWFHRVFLSALEAVPEDIFLSTQGGGEGDYLRRHGSPFL